ncbi:cytochrome P450 [Rhodococcus sp. Eu-32]|uniref:cytochrome P450 n=1 Tax=Rhodococcus sp. Eu-32 TaxID=1017319 RepID=UPI000DF4C1E3|nr:cytochrome P450 [Rhodococcus sp. Eu-32]RRQ28984.1 cytochrome P450 [Rhodococcus sp. Eu-32]
MSTVPMGSVDNRTDAAELTELARRFFSHDPDMIADPYPFYRKLREYGPAFRFKDRILVGRYDDCRRILTAPTTLQGLAVKGSRFRTAVDLLDEPHQVQLRETFMFYEKRLAGVDGAKHKRLRRLAQNAFTPRVVNDMRSHVEEIVERLLETIRGRTTVEFISDFAFHLPLIVICELLDVPTEDRDKLRAWSCDLGLFVGGEWSSDPLVESTHASVFALREYCLDHFARKRTEETTPLLRALLDGEGDGDRFSEEELVALITQMIFAGHETSTNLIGNSMIALLRDHRDQWNLLVEDPDRATAAVDELLRYTGPTQYIDKLAGEAGRIGDVDIEQWDTVSVFLASSNRDADAFPDGDVLDLTAKRNPHNAFGFGPHHCLGAALARMEAAIVLRVMAQTYPDMVLVDDHIEYHRNHMLRGPAHLEVELGQEVSQ